MFFWSGSLRPTLELLFNSLCGTQTTIFRGP